MAYFQTVTVPVTVDASGDATVYSNALSGYLEQIRYVKTDFADGVDFTITGDTTGATLWDEDNVNASVTVAPRQPTQTTAGVAINYAATFPVHDRIAIGNERIKIVVANGGNATSGTFYITVG